MKGGEFITIYNWYKSEGKSYICLSKKRIGLSKKLFNDMSTPNYVKLGYCDKLKSIIIKNCNENDEHRLEIKSGKYPAKINSLGFIVFLISSGVKIENKAKRYMAKKYKNGAFIFKIRGGE